MILKHFCCQILNFNDLWFVVWLLNHSEYILCALPISINMLVLSSRAVKRDSQLLDEDVLYGMPQE
jgi:hypothetical protein